MKFVFYEAPNLGSQFQKSTLLHRIHSTVSRKMMFYYQSPSNFPLSSRYWTPYSLNAPPSSHCATSDGDKAVSKEQHHPSNGDVTTSSNAPIIYQDRSVRIQHKDGNVVFSLDLPGIKSSDVKVEIHDGVLSVQAERKNGPNGSSKYMQNFLVKDYNVNSKDLHADLENGVLTITIPKKEETKPFLVAVEAEHPPMQDDNDKKAIRFSVDLPGVNSNTIKLEIHRNTINLHAERKILDRTLAIDKCFSLDSDKFDSTAYKAYLADGVLTFTGYLREIPEPKWISVTDGSSKANMAIEEEKNEDEKVTVETVTDEKN
jgi:HSP20 family molecular chaperone IbpA